MAATLIVLTFGSKGPGETAPGQQLGVVEVSRDEKRLQKLEKTGSFGIDPVCRGR